ncbi:hypothetical protein ONZ45_g10875 [Pleurotus djamor]|nr:hypothetical protein ONZ45_g13889 [Pleurotus djamor]KAJ8503418.1 hypothetical protein ONZ45_g10875 [Pleurotus djamor]
MASFTIINGLQVPNDRHFPAPKPDLSIYERPKSKIQQFFWKRRVWFEATFAFSMLEPWEKIMLFMIMFVFAALFLTGAVKYFPTHLSIMRRRAVYYLIGQEGDEYLLWQWLGLGVGKFKHAEL